MARTKSEKDGQAPPAPKIVGPNIMGKREEYRLERRLQSGLFGGVYEAKGLSSGRLFAVKVLHRSELHKAQRASSLEFCEVPLSEVKFMEVMRGLEHVMQVEDHFEDQHCFYIVFELAAGGDLLEALKLKPHGFEEQQAQFLIGQAARGLASLHERRLAMQDVSLENMLLHVRENGEFQVKVCDPGQAVAFEMDGDSGEEIPVNFHGLVGKSFRPPEVHRKEPYLATKVDAWCLGWSTFYLLAAQPLFLSADPAQQDHDWELFENGEFATLFRTKATSCSRECFDFILGLLQIDPRRRLSVAEALQHEWLRDHNARPLYAPKEFMPAAPPETPDKQKRNVENNDHGRNLAVTPQPAQAENGAIHGHSVSGSLNGKLSKEELRPQGLGLNGGLRGSGISGSLGGGLSAIGHFSSGGGPGGLGNGAPAWKMAPPRPESPGPSSAPMLQGYFQGAGSAGTPLSNPYASMQARASSPFTAAAPRGARDTSLQRRSPGPAPRQNGSLMRTPAGTNVYGGGREAAGNRSDLIHQSPQMGGSVMGPQSTHTPRPARISATNAAGPTTTFSSQIGSTRETRDSISVNPQGDGDTRLGMGGSSRHASAVGQPGAPAPRHNSPIPQPQASLVMRPQNVRGLSPSPMRNLAGSDPTWMQRSGSPMSYQQLGSSDSLGGTPSSQFWPSPRAASPSSGIFRAPGSEYVVAGAEAYSRGRSHTRALSPSQPIAPYDGSPAPPVVGGAIRRTMSPSGGVLNRPAGIAWSAVPPSPPAPKRSISPHPSIIVASHPNNQSTTSLRWEPAVLR